MKNIWAKIPKEVGWIGQFGGMLAIMGGIYFEYRTGAHIGWIIFSGGCFIYTIFTKVAHAKRR